MHADVSTFSGWPGLAFLPWLVLGAVWAVGALFSNRTVQREPLAQRLTYGVLLVSGCSLVFSHWVERAVPALALAGWQPGLASGVAGLTLTSTGVAFAIWARLTLGKLWSGSITFKEGHHLVQTGPYALARHPIYTGMSLALVGSAVAAGTLGAALGVPLALAGFVYKLSREERLMARSFPEEHAAYAAKVKRLVPLVW